MYALNQMYGLARAMRLGQLVYWGYHAPKGMIQKTLKRGVINRAADQKAQRQMEAAADKLPRLEPSENPKKIYFLSGRKFWYQTCFCAYSLVQQSGTYFRPVIYDDGSLSQTYQAKIKRIFPDAEIISHEVTEAKLDEFLPSQQFPTLRSRRLEYFNLRKLTDIHVNDAGWKLVLDSDMLFFRRPDFLVNWLEAPQQPCYMVDVETAYGYSDKLMRELAGAKIPEAINVGICGLQSDAIDWAELEYWCKTMIESEGTNYYQEQAMAAMLMARADSQVAPKQDYILMPGQGEARNPQGVMHHYVADSKPWYFHYGWKHIAGEGMT
ncbi:glycosyl transferase [filamentous cyanobacterium LEGE 11480]|uniref:Glycosyl transferase n=1 Tax=Romeriopsis navalis LEGE 11480 TaxID=2777977 RepID=A0A928VLW5_9CYAN|nr:glycosyl transferase [Romeriopsis navalis]MBE9031018.1 glycosyl transferase [Romeriopsis navalis LEGE 11480]